MYCITLAMAGNWLFRSRLRSVSIAANQRLRLVTFELAVERRLASVQEEIGDVPCHAIIQMGGWDQTWLGNHRMKILSGRGVRRWCPKRSICWMLCGFLLDALGWMGDGSVVVDILQPSCGDRFLGLLTHEVFRWKDGWRA